MERGFSRESKGSLSMQKKMAETRRRMEPAPDLTDFMNDMFFGTVDKDEKTYDLTGGGGGGGPGRVRGRLVMDEDDDFDDSTRSNSSRLTQEWLEEARRIVAASPTRCDPPARLTGSPRFAAAQGRSSVPTLDGRDPISRSARRNRALEGFSGEILSKSAKHSRNKSDTFNLPSLSPSEDGDGSPATAVHKWFSNFLKPTNPTPTPSSDPPPVPTLSTLPPPPPRHSFPRKSRFQTEPSAPHPQVIQVSSRRTFKTTNPSPEAHLLSPPKNVSEASNRRSFSSSNSLPLSPPRKLVESAHRRLISSTTCSLEKIAPRPDANGLSKQEEGSQDYSLNGFLKEQRVLIQKLLNRELNAKAKIVLSGPSNSTTSMVAAICYAWLLGKRQRERVDGREHVVVVPVMNVRRGTMWKLRQAAWLFHHAGLDATSLFFADEVDLESLLITGQLTMLVVGQDILSTIGEVGSQCTILTDNYCEDAYDLLQNPVLKKLLLAGILIDTQNLKASASISMTRDAEAVRLLLVGSAPNYRYALYDQLMQDQTATSVFEALCHIYGEPPDESDQGGEENIEQRVRETRSTSKSDREAVTPSPKKSSDDSKGTKTNKVSPKSAQHISPPLQSPAPAPAPAEKEASRGKNKFFLARWFGFGSK